MRVSEEILSLFGWGGGFLPGIIKKDKAATADTVTKSNGEQHLVGWGH
jgi:hypothetical protein